MYSFTSTVRYSECDSGSCLTIPGLINYMQDCSTFHTESINRGVTYCAKHHFAWFVAAWQIQIERLPCFTEEIRICTWSFKLRPTMASRNFLVETTDGECLVKADSLWFPFDTELKKPIRIPETEGAYLCDEYRVDLPPTKRKIRLTGDAEQMTPLTVATHHLDTNHHMNNCQYVAVANDVIRSAEKDFEPRRICVQYKMSAQLGDVIVPYLHKEENGYGVDLASPEGASYALVRMECA